MIGPSGIHCCPVLDNFGKKGCRGALAVFGARSNRLARWRLRKQRGKHLAGTARSLPPQAVPAFRSADYEPLPGGQLLFELARNVARYPAAVDESLDYLALLFRELFELFSQKRLYGLGSVFSQKPNQSFGTNEIFIVTWYSVILPFLITTFRSLTHALRTFSSVSPMLLIPLLTASSKLSDDDATSSVTLATNMLILLDYD
jgi:hypothetical protein